MLLFPEFLIGCGNIDLPFCRLCLENHVAVTPLYPSAVGFCKDCGLRIRNWWHQHGIWKSMKRLHSANFEVFSYAAHESAMAARYKDGPNDAEIVEFLIRRLTNRARWAT